MGKGTITLGDNVGINGFVIASTKRVEIGAGTITAPNCIIVDSDFHAPWPPDERFSWMLAPQIRKLSSERTFGWV
jgi:acetyltransferase-like isoleucine patch superfamily enzyme